MRLPSPEAHRRGKEEDYPPADIAHSHHRALGIPLGSLSFAMTSSIDCPLAFGFCPSLTSMERAATPSPQVTNCTRRFKSDEAHDDGQREKGGPHSKGEEAASMAAQSG